MAEALVRSFGRGTSLVRVVLLRLIKIGDGDGVRIGVRIGVRTGGGDGVGSGGGGVGFATINGGEPGAGQTGGGGEGVGAGRCWC